MVFNEQARKEGLPQLQTGIGLNAGEVVVGNIGPQKGQSTGSWGGPVNVTHRIQALAEGGDILVSESFMRRLPESFKPVKSFKAALKESTSKPPFIYWPMTNAAQPARG